MAFAPRCALRLLKLSSQLHGSANMVEENPVDAVYSGKADSIISRKRGRAETSKTIDGEASGGDSEGCSKKGTVSGRRKRMQTVAPAAETPVSRRYNLRRHKNAVLATPLDSADAIKHVKETDIHGRAAANAKNHEEETVADNEVVCTQVTTIRSEVQEVSSGNAARFARITSGTGESADPAEVAEIKETIQGGSLHTNYEEDQNVSFINDELGYDDEDEDDDEEEEDQSGDASIPKKLWNFFTT